MELSFQTKKTISFVKQLQLHWETLRYDAMCYTRSFSKIKSTNNTKVNVNTVAAVPSE